MLFTGSLPYSVRTLVKSSLSSSLCHIYLVMFSSVVFVVVKCIEMTFVLVSVVKKRLTYAWSADVDAFTRASIQPVFTLRMLKVLSPLTTTKGKLSRSKFGKELNEYLLIFLRLGSSMTLVTTHLLTKRILV